jgi:hypothetical protein
MTFHEHRNGMTVMDGTRCVAVARAIPPRGWLLTLHGGCWVDHRARTQGIVPGKFPGILNVNTRAEAIKLLRSLI